MFDSVPLREDKMMNISKKIISLILSLSLVLGASAAAAAGTSQLRSADVVVTLEPVNAAVDSGETAVFTLTVEGLGTDPFIGQISSITLTSSDPSVSVVNANIDLGSGYAFTPEGMSEPTGLQYTVSASAAEAGLSVITATVTDVSGNDYTCSATLAVKGIVAQPKNITIEVGESCVIFANRYGLSDSEATTNLTWTKSPAADWISMGIHGSSYRQREAYYVKGNSVGEGTVTVSLRSGSTAVYYDTINVSVVEKKSLTITQNGVEVTSPVDLSGQNDSAELTAETEGFYPGAVITWESSRPDLVSVSENSANSAIVTRLVNSDTSVAIKATVTDGTVTRTKTVYVSACADTPSLRISSPALIGNGEMRNITIRKGDTVTLSALVRCNDETATVWAATTEDGRVPLKLNSTVGKNITVTGRLSTNSPVAVTASNGVASDTVYVTVLPDSEKSIRITGTCLGADGVIVLSPDGSTELQAEITGFPENFSDVTWTAAIADNSENNSGSSGIERMTNLVTLSATYGLSTAVTAQEISEDFAKITAKINADGVEYTDTVYVKVTGCDIIYRANFITIYPNESITLSMANGESAEWYSNSQKAYFGNTASKPTYAYSESRATLKTGTRSTSNPCRITATQGGKDSVYVSVASGSRNTLSFDLNGGYGTAPDPVTLTADDTVLSVVLPEPEAFYPSDDGEYVFCGWSEYPDAISNTVASISRPIYFPGQTYSVTADKILYAIWAPKTENALFCINLSGDFLPEPRTQSVEYYTKSGIYIEGALNPTGFYYNVNGVDSRLAKVPSQADIA